MAKYLVKFYTGEYRNRQQAANNDKAVFYVEHHFNSGSLIANYSTVIVARNASKLSKAIGERYTQLISKQFLTQNKGVKVGGYAGKGDKNLYYTNMPAILLEPLFCSNIEHAKIIKSEEGRQKLAEILVQVIKEFFPEGGLIAFSVGHKYKVKQPRDKGARVNGGGWEADYAEDVLIRAKNLLEEGNF